MVSQEAYISLKVLLLQVPQSHHHIDFKDWSVKIQRFTFEGWQIKSPFLGFFDKVYRCQGLSLQRFYFNSLINKPILKFLLSFGCQGYMLKFVISVKLSVEHYIGGKCGNFGNFSVSNQKRRRSSPRVTFYSGI